MTTRIDREARGNAVHVATLSAAQLAALGAVTSAVVGTSGIYPAGARAQSWDIRSALVGLTAAISLRIGIAGGDASAFAETSLATSSDTIGPNAVNTVLDGVRTTFTVVSADDITTFATAFAGVTGSVTIELLSALVAQVGPGGAVPTVGPQGAKGDTGATLQRCTYAATSGSAQVTSQVVDLGGSPLVAGVVNGAHLLTQGNIAAGTTNYQAYGIYDDDAGVVGSAGKLICSVDTYAQSITGGTFAALLAGAYVINATNASPIACSTALPHGLTTGDTVTVSGALGNTAANVTTTVTVTNTTIFTLDGTTGNGAYTGGGRVVPAGDALPYTVAQGRHFAAYNVKTGSLSVPASALYVF